jgi:GT2 family glycosyltransferase/glycosyltransferase involved in cell wall biosynthesis
MRLQQLQTARLTDRSGSKAALPMLHLSGGLEGTTLSMKETVAKVRESGLIDETFYVTRHAEHDPILKFVDPVSHYLAIGFKMGFQCSPHLDMEAYLNRNPDVARSGMNPIVHFLLYGATEGRRLVPLRVREATRRKPSSRKLRMKDFRALLRRRRPEDPPRVDVIMPVYAGYEETLLAIYAVIASRNETAFEFVVIDDCSPERRLANMLSKLSALGLFTLVRNVANKGFVSTVNAGMRRSGTRDVILLNSDTVVYGDWIDRLTGHAEPDVATITPFSNNATLCSYPKIFEDNDLPGNISAKRLDTIAARYNRGMSVPVPTGVGFCFFMSRLAIKKIGMLDARTFGAGYGEENDFCRRAAAAGFRNLHALDVFVYHAGGTSFGASADARKARNLEKLLRRYPDYGLEVRRFAVDDPSRAARQAMDLARLTPIRGRKTVLCFSHALGGGIERYLLDRAKAKRDRELLIVARPEWRGDTLALESLSTIAGCPNLNGIPLPGADRRLNDLLSAAGIVHVEIHSLFGFNSSIVRQLPRLCRSLGVPYDFYLHDQSPICPRIHLVDDSNRYCGEGGALQCRKCLQKENLPLPPIHADLLINGAPTIGAWRSMYGALLRTARQVVCPSRDTLKRILDHYPKLNAVVVPHEQHKSYQLRRTANRRGCSSLLRIGVIGSLSVQKGALVIADCAKVALAENMQIEFVIIGNSPLLDERLLPNVKQTGRYEDTDLPTLIEHSDLDCIFLPSVCPETYMYTLSHAFESRLPVFVFNLGAQGERVVSYPFGHRMPLKWIDKPKRILTFIRNGLGSY